MSAQPKKSDIKVNGTVIPWSLVSAEAQNHRAPKGQWANAWRSAAQALVIRALLLQQAGRCGLLPQPQEISEDQLETDEEALIRQVLEQAVVPQSVDAAKLRAIYDAAPKRFRAPSLWEASHILFAADLSDTKAHDAARAAATSALAELAVAPKRFAALAEELSACTSRSAGGHLGQIGPGDTVREFEAALRQLKEGEISMAPVATRFGFHIIRLDATAEGEILPFESVLPRLREAAEKVAWIAASRAFTEKLLAAAEIEGITLAA